MTEYREVDYKKDVPEIVSLLRTSLSENHSEEVFLWKHTQNPFGKSYGWVATDGDQIVGVRMFMQWIFIKKEISIKAVRPVDTVTRVDYRGRGVFSTLNKMGLSNLQGEYDLIFNTPNENSRPGNLKLGWKRLGHVPPFRLSLLWPAFSDNGNLHFLSPGEDILKGVLVNKENFRTLCTEEYLKWRYSGEEYNFVTYNKREKSALIIFRTQSLKGIKIVVVNEIIGAPELHASAVRSLSKKLGIYFIYHLDQFVNVLKTISFKRSSPLVLYRDDNFDIHSELVFSLGDLEGRI